MNKQNGVAYSSITNDQNFDVDIANIDTLDVKNIAVNGTLDVSEAIINGIADDITIEWKTGSGLEVKDSGISKEKLDTKISPSANQFLKYDGTDMTWDHVGDDEFTDDTFNIRNATDITKIIKFNAGGITTGTTRTYTYPDGNTTLVGTDLTQALSNKTISSSTISSLSTPLSVANGGTGAISYTLGNILIGNGTTNIASIASPAGVLVGTMETQTLLNKSLSDSTTYFIDNLDATKKMQFQLSGIGAGATRTLTVPNFDGTIATLAGTETLTSKTLTNPIISTISNTGTLTLPTSTDTLVGRDTTDILTNKTLSTGCVVPLSLITGTLGVSNGGTGQTSLTASRFLVGNGPSAVDLSKVVPSGVVVGTTDTQTMTNKTLTTPVITSIRAGSWTQSLPITGTDDTLANLGGVQTLFNKTLSSSYVVGLLAPLAVADGGTGNLAFTSGNILTGNGGSAISSISPPAGSLVGTTATQTLTNKSLSDSTTFFIDEADATKKLQLQLSGITTATTRTLTAPNFNGTIATLAGTESLTNKTIEITDNLFTIQDNTTPAKKCQFELSGLLSGTKLYTLSPTGSTLLTESNPIALTQKKMDSSSCVFIKSGGSYASTEQLGFDLSSFTTNQGTLRFRDLTSLPLAYSGSDYCVTEDFTQTMKNKSLSDSTTFFIDEADATKKLQLQLSGITTGNTRTLTAPNFNGTIATLLGTETLGNKTLSYPIINFIQAEAVNSAVDFIYNLTTGTFKLGAAITTGKITIGNTAGTPSSSDANVQINGPIKNAFTSYSSFTNINSGLNLFKSGGLVGTQLSDTIYSGASTDIYYALEAGIGESGAFIQNGNTAMIINPGDNESFWWLDEDSFLATNSWAWVGWKMSITGGITASSDRRIKRDIRPVDTTGLLDTLSKIQFVYYKKKPPTPEQYMKDGKVRSKYTDEFLGVIAQEVKLAGLPEVVVEPTNGGYYSVKYDELDMYFNIGVQELIKINKQQQIQINDLMTRLERLEKKINI